MNASSLLSDAHRYLKQGSFQDALRVGFAILEAEPLNAQALQVIALVRHQQGLLDEADIYFRKSLGCEPMNPEVNFNYGNLLMHQGRSTDAVRCYRQCVEVGVKDPLLLCNLGAALGSIGEITESIKTLRECLAINPTIAEARQSLASNLMLSGMTEEAINEFKRAIDFKSGFYPNAEIGLLFCLTASDVRPMDEVYRAHLEWGKKTASLLPAYPAHFSISREPERQLRIGIVSADLKEHSVAAFLEPLLEASDRNDLDFFAYSETPLPDEVTGRLKGYFSVWRDVHGLADHAWADLVRSDSIDVLIDLSGHTTGSRLRAFSLRAAPVQISWLGYPNTTGLPQMDYRLADELTDPSGIADRYYSEKLLRLSCGTWCFRARDGTPPVSPRIIGRRPEIVFGSFNSVHKFNRPLIRLWARVLNSVPGSVFLLKAGALNDHGVRKFYRDMFIDEGILGERIIFADYSQSMSEHLSNYGGVDVALDSFPYAGTTTTFEALYMGVPVVTKRGQTHASRVGASILSRLGRQGWIADSDDEYVAIAAALASDSAGLASVRKVLRAELEGSVLMDKNKFCAEFSRVIRSTWTEWCSR